MKRLLLTLVMFLIVGLTAVPAFATVEVRVTDSIGTYFLSGSSCGANCSTAILSFNDADFNFLIQVGTSNGPAGPAVLTFSTNLSAKVANSPLTIEISDTGFLLPSANANLIQTLNTNTPVATGTASGTLSGTGFYGTGAGNVFFCAATAVCTAATPPANFNSFLVTNPGQTTQVATNFVTPFSLDEVLTASLTSAGNAQWQGTLSAITSVPEPASVVLLGGVLLALTRVMRRRKISA